MKFTIKHEIPGRIRFHINRNRLSFRDADAFEYCLGQIPGVERAKQNIWQTGSSPGLLPEPALSGC